MSCKKGDSDNHTLARHLSEFIGEMVTIFTTTGGISGCGFTGVLLDVNNDFVTIDSHLSSAPHNPLSHITSNQITKDSRSNNNAYGNGNWNGSENGNGGGLGVGIGGNIGGGIESGIGTGYFGIGGELGGNLGGGVVINIGNDHNNNRNNDHNNSKNNDQNNNNNGSNTKSRSVCDIPLDKIAAFCHKEL